MTDIKDIKNIIEKNNLTGELAKTASECMIELCEQCGMKKKLAKLGSVFENLTEGVIVFNRELEPVDLNKLGESIIREFKTFYCDGKSYKLSNLPILKEVLVTSKSSLNIELESYDFFGRKRIFTAGCSPVFSERNLNIGACMIISDITDIHKQARQMEDIVSALTHDLKTPLVAAENSLRHLQEGYFGPLTESQKEILNLMSQSNTDALRLVKNLLAVFKYETKSYKLLLEITDVSELIKKSVALVKPLADEKNITIKVFPSSFKFNCDPFEIERVVVNLLTNSIKYSDLNSVVEIRSVKDEKGKVTFVIEDEGIGISKEELPSLFERFWQSKKSEDKLNSTGLGLYLSRQIVEFHGGRIWAESKQGQGTRMTFEIPELV